MISPVMDGALLPMNSDRSFERLAERAFDACVGARAVDFCAVDLEESETRVPV